MRARIRHASVQSLLLIMTALGFTLDQAAHAQQEFLLSIDIVGNGTVEKEPLCSCGPNEVIGPLGDLTQDCHVNLADHGLMAAAWLSSQDARADLDNSGSVDLIDLGLLAEHYLESSIPENCNDPNRSTFRLGEKVYLTAIPRDSWVFLGWSGDLESAQNPYLLDITGPHTITATFAPVNYTISGNVGIEGVTMTGLPGEPLSAADGSYTVQVDYAWSGTVIPVKEGFDFDPLQRIYANVSSDQINQDYTPSVTMLTISGNTGLENVRMFGLPGNPYSDPQGDYSAQVTYGWSGAVTPTKDGYTFDPPSLVYDNITSDQLSQNYTPTINTYTISGNTGIEGVTLNGLPGEPVSAPDGSYSVTVNYGFSATVSPTKDGYSFDPNNRQYTNVDADQLNQDYTPTINTYTISGNTGVEGVALNGLPGNPVSAPDGSYSATVEYGFSATVTPAKEGYTFSPTSRTYTNVDADQLSQDYAPTINTYTISGNAGIEGVTMTGLPGDPISAPNGNYSVLVDYGFSATVTPAKTGYTFSPTSRTYTNVDADEPNQDYTPTINTYTITGNVGLEGVALNGLPGNPVSAPDGSYSATVDYGFSATVTPTKDGYTFNPASLTYTSVDADQSSQDYTPTINTYTISGNTGIEGVSLTGLPGDPVSAPDGSYSVTVDYGFSATVTPAKEGYTFNPASRTYTSVDADQSSQDYTPIINTYAISGNAGTKGVTLTGLPGEPVSASDGSYSALVEHGWTGTVVPVRARHVFNPLQRDYTNVTADLPNQDYAATATSYLISGHVNLPDVRMFGLPGDPYTDVEGFYSTEVDPSWSGAVTPLQEGYTFVPITRIYLDMDDDQIDQDYVGTINIYTISGNVGIPGVTLTGLPGDPVSQPDGSYSVDVEYGFSATVIPLKLGYTFNPPQRVYYNVDDHYPVQDYTPTYTTHIISGNAGTEGVVMTGLPSEPVSDAEGFYSDVVEHGWAGDVIPVKEGWTFDPNQRTYPNVVAEQLNQDYIATINTYLISGNVGLEGVSLTGLPSEPNSAPDGSYSDLVEHGWSGTVIPVKQGYTFDPNQRDYTDVTADEPNQDFTPIINTYTITGNVDIPGVTLDGLPGNPLSDPNGNYQAVVEYGFSATVMPVKQGYTFEPNQRLYEDVDSDQPDQDYSAIINTYTISGNVGMEGVTLTGLPGEPLSETDGSYSDTVDYGFSGTIIPVKAGFDFDPVERIYANVSSDQLNQDYTWSVTMLTISGNAGLEGVRLFGLPDNPLTGPDGSYSAQVVYGWSGAAVPSKAGYTFTPTSRIYDNITTHQSDQHYTPIINTYTISGNVQLAGVTLNGLPGNPTSEPDGSYSVQVDYGFSATVTPTKQGYTFAPDTRLYTNVDADQLDQDYTPIINTYLITGNVGVEGAVLTGLPGEPLSQPDGSYSAAVNYGFSATVVPVKLGYVFAPAQRDYINVDADQTNQDYSPTYTTHTISGNTGIEGVTLTGLPGEPLSAPDGSYNVLVEHGFSATVTPTKTGYTFDPPTRQYTNVIADEPNQDYTPTINTYTISGNAGIGGVTLNGLPGEPVSEADGTYSVTVDYGFSATVTPTKLGYIFDPNSRTYSNVDADQLNQDYTPTLIAFIISGNVGIEGATLAGLPGEPLSQADGSYSGLVDYGFSGTVTPTKLGYTFDPNSRTYDNVTENHTEQNYTPTINTYTISGNVGIEGVTLTGLPSEPLSAPDGSYSVTVDHGFSATVTPTKEGYTFDPDSHTYTNVDADQLDQDYTPTMNTYTISGNVGIEGATLAGLPGEPLSAPDGSYTATVDYGYSATVVPVKIGYTFTPDQRDYTNVANDFVNQDYTPTAAPFTISGLVGIPDVTMVGLPGSPTSDAQGLYSGQVAAGFSGTVTPTKDHYIFEPNQYTYDNVLQDYTNQDFVPTWIDHFNEPNLELDIWTFVDPLGGGAVSTNSSILAIYLPAGTDHDAWPPNRSARIIKAVDDSDCQITARFNSVVSQRFQSQGFLVEQDSDNWLRFDVYHNGSSTRIYAASVTNGSAATQLHFALAQGTPPYLAIEREGNAWTFYYSYDGQTWPAAGTFYRDITTNYIGIFAGNASDSGSDAPAFTCLVDYITYDSEILTRDPNQNLLTFNIVGEGSVSTEPNLPTYPLGQQLTLTAVPSGAYNFTGWTGPFESTDNPVTFTVRGDHNITANFEANLDIVSDQFTDPQLDTQIWSVVDPLAQTIVSLSGDALLIDVPQNLRHAGPAMIEENATDIVLDLFCDDDPADGALDSSYYQNHGSAPAASQPALVTGYIGSAYDFDGADDYISIPDHSSLDVDHITLATWIFVNQYKDDQRIISKEVGTTSGAYPYSIYTLLLNGTDEKHLQFRLGIDNERYMITSPNEIPLQQWTHIAATYDGSKAVLYINGQVDHIQYGINGPIMHNDNDLYIGNSQFYSRGFDGIIDEVRLYNTALSDQDIANIVANGGFEPLPSTNLAPRVMQNVTVAGDFEIQAKFDSDPTLPNQIQGLLVQQDDDRYLVFDLYADSLNTWIIAATYDNTNTTVHANTTIIPGAPYYLRIGRQGSLWTCAYSYDEQNWTTAASFADTFSVNAVGAFAGNHHYRDNVPPFLGVIDYFYNNDDPIPAPEDPDPNTNTLTTHVYGSGSIDKNPDLTDYAIDQQVILTAIPDVNWTFVGWSGVLAGMTNPATLTITGDHDVTALFQAVDPEEYIDIWYGDSQDFGHIGIPQTWVNLLGTVANPEKISTLTYTLNGQTAQPLSIGTENERLVRPGDFNIEIDHADLTAGLNNITVTATYASQEQVARATTVDYLNGNIWPQTYAIDWDTVTNIQDVAQIVDGFWQLEPNAVRPAQIGYDRLLAIGDVLWEDYEITVPITVNDVGFAFSPGTTPGVGILIRWSGHVQWNSHQPRIGWYLPTYPSPMGALPWFHWGSNLDSGAYEFVASNGTIAVTDSSGQRPQLGVTYNWKVRAEGHEYKLRVWPDGQVEPATWLITYTSDTIDPLAGSLLLLAHDCDATFGNVSVTPIP